MAQFRPKQLAHLDPKSVAQIRPFYPELGFLKYGVHYQTAIDELYQYLRFLGKS